MPTTVDSHAKLYKCVSHRWPSASKRVKEENKCADISNFLLQVGEDDLDQALTAAVVCCILAAAGPQRSRVLANLYKDERTARLPVFLFLEKVYLEHILRRQEVKNATPCRKKRTTCS